MMPRRPRAGDYERDGASGLYLPRREMRAHPQFMVGPAFFGGSSGGDPYYSSVSSLLHMDGADASTTFTDQKGKTYTPAGSAKISTAQSKFGGASGLFNGTTDYISTPYSADFDFGGGDFSIECWARITTLPASGVIQTICGCYTAGTRIAWLLYVYNSSGVYSLNFDYSVNGTSGASALSSTFSPVVNTWYNLTAIRSSGQLKLYVEGALIGSASFSQTIAAATGSTFKVGAYYNVGDVGFFSGYIDEMRVTKGVARYTAAFTPPAAAFPNS